MGNTSVAIKKLLTNKNTVTIIGVILGVVVLYLGYNWRIQSQLEPISIPYAIKKLTPRTKITSDMIGTMNVPKAMLKGKVIVTDTKVIGQYVNVDSVIPAGSLFYEGAVVSNLPDKVLFDIPQGYTAVNMAVNTESTYGNLIYPGNFIDIYLKAVTKTEQGQVAKNNAVMVGKLLTNVKVLAVNDAAGNNVFEDNSNKGTPAMIIFAVPEEYHILLRKAMYLRTYEATLIPVPTNESFKQNPGDVSISSPELKKFINDVTVWTGSTEATNTILPVR